MAIETSFPRQYARTQRFTLGAPRSFTVAPDGSRVVFLRSAGGTDRQTRLWSLDTATGEETCVADPGALLAGDGEDLPPEERAMRERRREGAGGIVGYATDNDVRVAAFTLSGRLFVADLLGGEVRALGTVTAAVDPRPDPTGSRVAYAAGGALRVIDVDGHADRPLVEPEHPDSSWGVAEFIAAEEMGRSRGFWWSQDGTRLLVTRVDEGPVRRWHIADPANPDAAPTSVAYPVAGTGNAVVRLAVVGLDGNWLDVTWDDAAFPYLADVHWSSGGAPLVTVQSRNQRTLRVLAVDPDTGATTLLAEDTDPHWVELVPGAPVWTPDGRLVRVVARDGAYRLLVGGEDWTGDGVQVRAVLDVSEHDVLVTASTGDPTEVRVLRVARGGATEVSDVDGVHTARRGGPVTVLSSSGMDWFGTRNRVLRDGEVVAEIASHAERPVVEPNVTLLTAGERWLRCALLLPTGYRPESGPLPVLLDPYGGPHAQRVLRARNAYLTSQWLADQGFAVLVADGRGTPGRGPDWDRAVAFDFAGATLEDQVDALHAVAAKHPELDTSRVAIRGWSYGGYLAALAVLRRPDVFHAAIAGAPVTDWRLYDTHYTERYLGHPDERPDVYDANSLLGDAAKLEQPLLLIHGLADDNVVAAHTLRLSAALLAAGRPHTVLPLSGVTHMTPQEQVAENLLLIQVNFLRGALGLP
ncbi:S9 family peptidase [Gandjariella thermophila]|uniref:S9 family peptidase n=1 Tax=Gandjariella thermophila TaxID=1931992 RepID=UPI0010F61C47|nr:prolyl oligopeptidase family serine peptidase [Gandjariella thermophila]